MDNTPGSSSSVVVDYSIGPEFIDTIGSTAKWEAHKTTSKNITFPEFCFFSEVNLTNLPPTTTAPKTLVSNWSLLATSNISNEGYERIKLIASKEDGWYGKKSSALTVESLHDFLVFYIRVKDISVEPEMSLNPYGHIQAEWYKDDKHYFEIEFCGKNQAYFAMQDGKSVFEAKGKITEIENFLRIKKNNPLTWE